MTEERMIRVNDMPEYDLKVAKVVIYYSHDGYVQPKDMMVETTAIREMIEIAPPKDWRPACWTGDLKEDPNGCNELYFEEDGAISKPCLSCPFRKCLSCPFRKLEEL